MDQTIVSAWSDRRVPLSLRIAAGFAIGLALSRSGMGVAFPAFGEAERASPASCRRGDCSPRPGAWCWSRRGGDRLCLVALASRRGRHPRHRHPAARASLVRPRPGNRRRHRAAARPTRTAGHPNCGGRRRRPASEGCCWRRCPTGSATICSGLVGLLQAQAGREPGRSQRSAAGGRAHPVLGRVHRRLAQRAGGAAVLDSPGFPGGLSR